MELNVSMLELLPAEAEGLRPCDPFKTCYVSCSGFTCLDGTCDITNLP